MRSRSYVRHALSGIPGILFIKFILNAGNMRPRSREAAERSQSPVRSATAKLDYIKSILMNKTSLAHMAAANAKRKRKFEKA